MQALLDAIHAMTLPGAPGGEPQRVFHGRGGLHPGCEHWALDFYPPVFVLTSFSPVDEDALARVHAALAIRWTQLAPDTPLTWVHQTRHAALAETHLMLGQVPEPHVVSEDSARYRVQVLRGQNHGLFLDMAEGRRWVRNHVSSRPGLRVLNLFAYTCAFSVVARLAGAGSVVNLDMSHSALATGQHNHQLNGLREGVSFLAHDLFKSWGKINRLGPYGLVIVDPPSYQKGSFVARKDYARILRRLPELLAPDGHALLCLNAPELNASFLHQTVQAEAPALEFVERLLNPPAFADVDAQRALKVLVYRVAP